MAMKEGMKFPSHYPLTRLVGKLFTFILPVLALTLELLQRGGEEPEEDPKEDQEQVVCPGQQEEEEGVRGLHGGPGEARQRRKRRT